MKQPNHSTRIPLLAAVALAAGLVACSKPNDEDMSASKRLDGAVAEAKSETREATADVKAAANQAADTTVRVTTDMSITAKVNAALAVDDHLKAMQINVDTRDGQVTLSGQAPDARSRERATTLAAAVEGVKQVNNQLVLNQNG